MFIGAVGEIRLVSRDERVSGYEEWHRESYLIYFVVILTPTYCHMLM